MPRSKRLVIGLAVAGVVVAAGVTTVVLTGGHGSGTAAAPPAAGQTVTVTRTDLSDTRPTTGTLGFGAERPVKGTKNGMITWLPASGEVLTRGKVLYRADDKPVAAFHGDIPLFRPLGPPPTGTSAPPPPPADKSGPQHGRDVKMVADNLKALGYDVGKLPAKDEATWTPALTNAVKRWQRDLGVPQTGTLNIGDVVVLPGDVRIGGISARLGGDALGDLMTVTPTGKVVTVQVEAATAATITRNSTVRIVLPDSKEIAGKVGDISRTVTTEKTPGDSGPPKMTVTVTIDDAAAVANIDSADVQVKFVSDTRTGVLAVPVTALVALREGGYAVQTADRRYLPVQTGLFAMGMVEISGPGVTEGLNVVVAS